MQYQKLQQQMEEEIGALAEKIKRKTQAAGGDTAPASVTAKPPKVSEVQAEVYPPDASAAAVDTVTHREAGGKSKKSQGPKTETDQIGALRAEVLEIKKLMLQTVEATQARPTEKTFTPSRSRPRGCRACQEAQI
ncbi:hypothetical protein JOQ06_003502, partial [Pogonophryne albipinna]